MSIWMGVSDTLTLATGYLATDHSCPQRISVTLFLLDTNDAVFDPIFDHIAVIPPILSDDVVAAFQVNDALPLGLVSFALFGAGNHRCCINGILAQGWVKKL